MAEPLDTIDIDFNQMHSTANTTGFEPAESDPVIDTLLEDIAIYPVNGCNDGQSCYVEMAVDFRVKPRRRIKLFWSKDGNTIKSGDLPYHKWSGRSTLRFNHYNTALAGIYLFSVKDLTSRRAPVDTQCLVNFLPKV